MQIYLVKGYLDVAATSLADAMLLFSALANPSTSANAATIARVTGKLETLVQSDSGDPLVISSIDDAVGTISSWVTDSSAVISVGLGDPDTGNTETYASALGLSITGSTRTGTIALNTAALADALRIRTLCSPRAGSAASFTLQIRKTSSVATGSVTETLAMLSVGVRAGVLTSPLQSGNTDPSYIFTTLTGGGSTALDGLSVATLAGLTNGATFRLYFSGSILADFRIRANTGSETESAPWRVICDNDTSRLWELLAVTKQGSPCVWASSLSKFKQVIETGGALALADDADAFVLP